MKVGLNRDRIGIVSARFRIKFRIKFRIGSVQAQLFRFRMKFSIGSMYAMLVELDIE